MKTLTLIFSLLVAGVTYAQTPGEITSFNAEKVNNTAVLTWSPTIAPETNHFEIQRSDDGVNWKVVALMFPYEDGTVSHTYKYSDKLASDSKVHYRIRQIDINKKENFSQVKLIGELASK
jgi:hypothetical protein